MTETPILECAPVREAPAPTSTPRGRVRRVRPSRRLGTRLWTLLRAPALLDGGVGVPGDVALIEDDRGRLAGRQAR